VPNHGSEAGKADSSFSIDSIGIEGDLISQSFDVLVLSSTNGHDVGAVLASESVVVGGTGDHFYDVPSRDPNWGRPSAVKAG
jgi:hypothetical protein